MEQTRKIGLLEFNLTSFIWCLTLPVVAFVLVLSLGPVLNVNNLGSPLSRESLSQFLQYYNSHMVNEGLQIFLNNFTAVLVMVYFTPLALGIRQIWEKWRCRKVSISVFEKNLLFLFPGLFLIRQAINVALVLNNFSANINKSVVVTLAGIILPHGLPELISFSLAGAVGMEVTRKLLFSSSTGKLVGLKELGLLLFLTASCAFLEVFLTPRVFMLLMS